MAADELLDLLRRVDERAEGNALQGPERILGHEPEPHEPRAARIGDRDAPARVLRRLGEKRLDIRVAAHHPVERHGLGPPEARRDGHEVAVDPLHLIAAIAPRGLFSSRLDAGRRGVDTHGPPRAAHAPEQQAPMSQPAARVAKAGREYTTRAAEVAFAVRFLPFVLRHLQQARLRTASTVAGMALCVFLFCTLQTVLARLNGAIESRSPRRLVTTNVAEMLALPASCVDRIARVPGVVRVARVTVFGGFLRGAREGKVDAGSGTDWTRFFQNLAVDAEPYLAMSPELLVPPDQLQEFRKDIRGCLVGRTLADKLQWKIGDHFFLESFASGLRKPDGPFEYVIRGLVDTDFRRYPGTETDVMYFHFKYLETALGPAARPSFYESEIADPARAAEVAGAIDALFENSSDPTLTQTEKAFLTDLVSMVGDVSGLLHGIGIAVCFTLLLVTANTMGMAMRERRTEVAVLKTLGFTGAQVMGLVLAEGLLLGALGGGLGIGGTEAVLWILRRRPGLMLPGVAVLELSPRVALLAAGVALFLGLLAAAVPAWGAYRSRVTEMLRAV
jgi:putative ABC transport system permease protein